MVFSSKTKVKTFNKRFVVVLEETFSLGNYSHFTTQVLTYAQFVYNLTDKAQIIPTELEKRMKSQGPGSCLTYVFTSGTTGNPKGVMLSHDNYTYNGLSIAKTTPFQTEQPTQLSFLPCSHVAAQVADLVLPLTFGSHVYFTDAMALKGTLINYLKEIRPNFVVTVPRVYEKMADQVVRKLSSKERIFKWARRFGREGTDAQMKGEKTGIRFKIFEKLVYNRIKKELGLDKAEFLVFGAAPLPNEVRQLFFDLNMYLANSYGLSETAGPIITTTIQDYPNYDLKATGIALPGFETRLNSQGMEEGELMLRGRCCFMGYLKNEEATKKAIDNLRFLRTGDLAKIDEKNIVTITGRIKEIIVTAGGENIAPIPIEFIILQELPFLSQAMLIGDQRKFISALLTLKITSPASELPTDVLADEAKEDLAKLGVSGVTTVHELLQRVDFLQQVQLGNFFFIKGLIELIKGLFQEQPR